MASIKVTDAEARAFLHLKAPEFDAFRGYLERVRAGALDDMALVGDADAWRRLQGRAAFAKELLDYIGTSAELVAKLSRP